MSDNNNNNSNDGKKQVFKSVIKDSKYISTFIKFLYVINPYSSEVLCTVKEYVENIIRNPGPSTLDFGNIRTYIQDNKNKKIFTSKKIDNESTISFYMFLLDREGNYINVILSIDIIETTTRKDPNSDKQVSVTQIKLKATKDDKSYPLVGIISPLLTNGENLRVYNLDGTQVNGIIPKRGNRSYVAVVNFNPFPVPMERLIRQYELDPYVDVTPYLWNVGHDRDFTDRPYNTLTVIRRPPESPNIIIPDSLIAQQLAQNSEINNNNVINVENAINSNNNNNDFGNDDEFENNEAVTNVKLPKVVWDFFDNDEYDASLKWLFRNSGISINMFRPATKLLTLELEPERYARPTRFMERGPVPVLGIFPTEIEVPPRSDMFAEQPATELLPIEIRDITQREIYQLPESNDLVPMNPVELPIFTNEEVRLIMRTAQGLYYGRYAGANIELANEARLIMVRDNIERFVQHLQEVNTNNPNEQQVDIEATVNNILNTDINTITNSDALINLYNDPDLIIGYNRNDIVYRAIMNIIRYEGTTEMEPLYVYTNNQDVVLQTIQDIYNGNYVQELLTDSQIQKVEQERLRMIAFNAANAFNQNMISGDDYNDIMQNNNYYPRDDIPNAFADADFVFGNGPLPIVEVAQGLIALQQNAVNQAHGNYNTFVYKMALVSSACAILSAYGISWLFDYDVSIPTKIVGTIYNWVNNLTSSPVPTDQALDDVMNRIKNNVPESRVLLPGRVPIKHESNQISPVPSMSVSISQALDQNSEVGSYLLASASLSNLREPGINRMGPYQLDHLVGPVTNQTLSYVANAMVPLPTTPILETNQPSLTPQIGRSLPIMPSPPLSIARTPRPLSTKLRGQSAPWIVNYNKNENLPSSTPMSPSKSYTGSPSFSPTPTPTISPKLKEELEKQPKSFGDYVDKGVNYLGSVVSRGLSYTGTIIGAGLTVATEVAYRGFQLTMTAATEGGKFALKSIGTVGGLLITGVVAVVGYLIFRKR